MTQASTPQETGGPARRIDGLGWALAFIWAGVALLADIGWGWLLAGLGVIILGAQAALRMSRARTSGFWIACGVVLLGSGVWELLRLQWPLAPVLFILVGVAILFSALGGGRTRR
jgi:hypothetical protein